MLDGAMDGIRQYLTPKWENLFTVILWKDAGTQVFFSYGVGLGGIILLGAYNEFNHAVVR